MAANSSRKLPGICRKVCWQSVLLLVVLALGRCSGGGVSGGTDVFGASDFVGQDGAWDSEDGVPGIDSSGMEDGSGDMRQGWDLGDFILPDITDPGTPFPVLNEVNCHDGDFIEIYNRSPLAEADLSGFVLRDLADATHQFVFPEGTVLAPESWLLVAQDSTVVAGLKFGLKCGSDVVELLDADGELMDQVVLPLLAGGVSLGRLPDGSGEWAPNEPTAGMANRSDPSAALFDTTTVSHIVLTIPPSSLAALEAAPREYAAAEFSMGGESFTGTTADVGVHLKGGTGSYQELDGKPAWKVKFNFAEKEDRFRGLKKISLNNMVQDPSMIHEALSYRLFAALGVPAPRVGYATVEVNGHDYGLYLVLENYDDISLQRFFSSTLHLYEQELGEDVLLGMEDSFEIDEGEEDRADLLMLTYAIAETPDVAWLDEVGALLDFGMLQRMWAVEMYVGHIYGYASAHDNYFLHSDEDSRFTMLPSGTDQTFVEFADFHSGEGLLFQKCLSFPECRDGYHWALAELAAVVDATGLPTFAQDLRSTIEASQVADVRQPYGPEEIAAGYETVFASLETMRLGLETLILCLDAGDSQCPD